MMLCDLFARKNNKLGLSQIFLKNLPMNELTCMKFHGFQAKWARYDHNHGIVFSNNITLCIVCDLESQTMLLKGVFFYLHKKSFSIFLAPKMGFLWSTYQKYIAKMEHPNF
jgi:hypothetical protein